MILSGKVTGYSLGGMFELTEYDFSKQSEQFHSTNITERFKSTYGESFTNGSGVLLTVEDNAVKSNVESFNGNDCTFYIDGEMLTKCVVKNGKVVEFSDEDDVKVKETAMEAGMIFSKYCVKVEVEIEECEDELKDDITVYDNANTSIPTVTQDDVTEIQQPFTIETFSNTPEPTSELDMFKTEMLTKMEEMMNNYNSLQSKYDEMMNSMSNMLQEKDKTIQDKEKQLANVIKEVNSEPIKKQSFTNNVEQSFNTPKLRIGNRMI
jgi:hypothetical protein